MNRAICDIRTLIVDKPIALFKSLDFPSYFCEETCRACGRSVLEESEDDGDENPERRSKRVCLCQKCHVKFMLNRQSLWFLPVPDGSRAGVETTGERRKCNTTFDTTKILPVATAGMYEGVMQKLIRKLKYDDDRLVVRDIDALMQRALAKLQNEVEAFRDTEKTLIVPIPLHKSRERKRGYNQAALLARGLADDNRIRLHCDALKRVKKTKPQFGLNKQDRLANIEEAFILGPTDVTDKYVILVDDVFTSGATLTSCAKLFTTGGARHVAAIAAARAPYDR